MEERRGDSAEGNGTMVEAHNKASRAKTDSSHGSKLGPSAVRFRELLTLMLSECEPTAFPGLMVIATSVVEEAKESMAK